MISAFINGQTLKLSTPKVVADSVNYLTLKAVFKTTGWEDLTKWVHFKKDNTTYNIELINDEVTADQHLNLPAGEWQVYIHGSKTVSTTLIKRITTEIVILTVEPSGVLNGEPLPLTPPSIGEQILAKAQSAENIAQSVRDDADAGEFDGEPGPTGPAGPGVSTGGTTGQILRKKSNSNYDTEWVDSQIDVTPADVGKFARVNSQGQWVAEEVPNANGVNF